MIVAELKGTNLEESAVVDHAIKMLSQSATVRLNIPARIYQVYGRQLTLEGTDGSRSMVQLFDYKARLYQIEAKTLPDQNVSNPQSDVVRFHQSLSFTSGLISFLIVSRDRWKLFLSPGTRSKKPRPQN
jgi:hypothetical protein